MCEWTNCPSVHDTATMHGHRRGCHRPWHWQTWPGHEHEHVSAHSCRNADTSQTCMEWAQNSVIVQPCMKLWLESIISLVALGVEITMIKALAV